jgi:predicted nucleotidyltransferase
MRFHNALDDILGNPLRLRVLRVLTRSPSQGFTGREMARHCDASPSQTIRALESLEDSGIVTREVAGPAHVWRVSPQHLLSDPLLDLFKQEERLLPVLKSEIRALVAGLPIQRAVIFGSVARGEEQPASDVDLFVEVRTPNEKDQVEGVLSAASPKFALRFGNPLSSLVLTDRQVRRPSNSQIMKSVSQDGEPISP